MSCILRFWGEDFDVDAFIEQSGIAAYSIFRKGEPKYESKPDGEKNIGSGCMIEVSKADFAEFKKASERCHIILN